jgi:hypothetical protein
MSPSQGRYQHRIATEIFISSLIRIFDSSVGANEIIIFVCLGKGNHCDLIAFAYYQGLSILLSFVIFRNTLLALYNAVHILCILTVTQFFFVSKYSYSAKSYFIFHLVFLSSEIIDWAVVVGSCYRRVEPVDNS